MLSEDTRMPASRQAARHPAYFVEPSQAQPSRLPLQPRQQAHATQHTLVMTSSNDRPISTDSSAVTSPVSPASYDTAASPTTPVAPQQRAARNSAHFILPPHGQYEQRRQSIHAGFQGYEIEQEPVYHHSQPAQQYYAPAPGQHDHQRRYSQPQVADAQMHYMGYPPTAEIGLPYAAGRSHPATRSTQGLLDHGYVDPYQQPGPLRQAQMQMPYAPAYAHVYAPDAAYAHVYMPDAGQPQQESPSELKFAPRPDLTHQATDSSHGSRKEMPEDLPVTPSARKSHSSEAMDETFAEWMGTTARNLATPNQLAYLGLVIAQAVSIIAMMICIFVNYQRRIDYQYGQNGQSPRQRSIQVYLVIFVLAELFALAASLDALRLRNTIQLVGLCFFSLLMMIYAALMPTQLLHALGNYESPAYLYIHKLIVATAVVLGITAALQGALTFRLYSEYGWEVFKQIGADRRIKSAFTYYQIFACILKFDLYFLVGFAIQYLILVLNHANTTEFAVTIAALPIILVAIFSAAVAVRLEVYWLAFLALLLELAGMVYFIYKLFRLYDPTEEWKYLISQRTLTAFSVVCIVLLAVTCAINVKCCLNFGIGLKDQIPRYWTSKPRVSRKANGTTQDDERQVTPGRWTID
ncbi:uncharacterized protein L969DRAFT_25633 [Mixia osmundae IAM 14324]|uniref:TRP C-terminal domain-containing protein n=1 Tax=Mixia osmundae (strain CBS 9802 / IAM 14324 / JCM 22182 / KY 12970) TaxID=764103 RepID=G7E4Y5_MIXOS|nr:uncharacterized protein L969DRAFT_25633 [Mixia osmundae IAM 14324]KEI37756.1 hypothetical protein L969DRAFT_25633 [Mixia osmundae IAM 14324]GAA97895.1 hypothetical protein E5Q_04575 [Mixia osmundae IAM 14324]